LAELIDRWIAAGDALSEALLAEEGFTVWDEFEDMRTETWNGDVERPKWYWQGEEWLYQPEFGREVVRKEGLVFVHTFDNGRWSWLVFDETKVEEHEEF
jgi:hypothetical protein